MKVKTEVLKVKTEMLKVNFNLGFTNYADNPIYRHLPRVGNRLPAIYGHSYLNYGASWARRLPAVRKRPSAIRPAWGAYGARDVGINALRAGSPAPAHRPITTYR